MIRRPLRAALLGAALLLAIVRRHLRTLRIGLDPAERSPATTGA